MVLRLPDAPPAPPSPAPWIVRPVRDGDRESLSLLMLESYRGTVDDDGETLDDAREEVRRTFDGEYGSLLLDASLVAEHGSRLGSASLVTLRHGLPLLAFTMTHPDAKNRGLATALVGRSIDLLRATGNEWLRLVVTEGNDPAIHLYEKLGFLRTR
jgi:GNAT superfamily N-acetyltransferase